MVFIVVVIVVAVVIAIVVVVVVVVVAVVVSDAERRSHVFIHTTTRPNCHASWKPLPG